MMPGLHDIFSDEEGMLSDDELRRYLDAQTSEEEKHELEKKMGTSSFESEAAEGLQKFKQKEKLDDYVKQLNKNLQQQLAAKKQVKEKRKIKELPFIVLLVIIILSICILSYMVIRLYHQSTAPSNKQQGSIHQLK